MPVRRLHGFKDFEYEIGGHLLMEEVAHRVDEDGTRLFPFQGKLKPFRPQLEIEPLLKRMTWHSAKPLRERLGVTMLATRADFRAAGDGVPGGISPFDGRIL